MSCTKNFEDLNKNVKNPVEVSGDGLFSNAEKALSDQIVNTNVNTNVFRLFAQYWTETTYTDESNYDVVTRTITDSEWRAIYRDVLKDLVESKRVIELEKAVLESDIAIKKNKIAINDILTIFAYERLVSIFGNIPYTEAFNIDNTTPKYDDAATVYKDLLTKLDADIAILDIKQGSFGDADLIYAGKTESWKKFANSLKLKMGMLIADYDPSLSKTTVESAVTAGIFTSSADNAVLVYKSTTPNTNPLYVDLVLSGRFDFVATSTIVDIMNTLSDPRRSAFFATVDGSYIGGIYGASNNYASFSNPGSKLLEPTIEGVIMDFTETQFFLAEAAERGYSVGGTAESFYNSGISSSIVYWGGTVNDATAYLANSDVAYTTATGTFKQKIATQSWIANYNRGLEGWTVWRRLDAPTFNPPADMTNADIPTRFIYPIGEQTLNGANYTSASAAIGSDLLTTKLFWDKF